MRSAVAIRRAAGTLLVSAAALGLSCGAAGAAADFSGKRVTIVVPFSEGGGTDSWTRMMVPYLEKTLPGNPTVVVLNKPGAGGIPGTNYYHDKAPNDGTMIYALSISVAMNYAFRDPRIKFKLEEFHPVLSSPRGSTYYVRKELGLGEIKDIKGKVLKLQSTPPDKLIFGGRTPTSVDMTYRVTLSLLGVEVHSVWGLGGTGPMALGFERGEFTISGENTLAFMNTRKHMIDSGIAQAIFTSGNFDDNGKYTRDPARPDLPSVVEAYEAVYGKKPSGPAYEAWESLVKLSIVMNKTLLLHPSVNKEAVEAWRTAVREMLKNADFRKIADQELGPYPQIVGEPIREIMKKALTIDPEAHAWLAKYVKTRYDVDLTPKSASSRFPGCPLARLPARDPSGSASAAEGNLSSRALHDTLRPAGRRVCRERMPPRSTPAWRMSCPPFFAPCSSCWGFSSAPWASRCFRRSRWTSRPAIPTGAPSRLPSRSRSSSACCWFRSPSAPELS